MDLHTLLQEHFRSRPLMQVQDVYKLLYQSVFGVGHMLGKNAYEWLEREWEEVDVTEQQQEKPMESISYDRTMYRMNLRPLKRTGFYMPTLYGMMVATEHCNEGKLQHFLSRWDGFRHFVRNRRIFMEQDVEHFDEKMKEKGYPLTHHSEEYRKEYKPAYRVIAGSVLQDFMRKRKKRENEE